MKYRCLILDHDDTVVNSTALIHWPSFQRVLAQLRPDVHWTLQDWLRYNFSPGFLPTVRGILHFTDEEMAVEQAAWQADVAAAPSPPAFPGIRQRILRFREEGGSVCVVSHSHRDSILQDYRANDLPAPDLIFGWELPPDKIKPSVWPLQTIMKTFDLAPSDLVVVDDLKPGLDMARGCGVDFLASGWAWDVPEIAGYFEEAGVPYLRSVAELDAFLFDSPAARTV